MPTRKRDKVSELDVLTRSGRRCCVCYGLHRDFGEKQGQIAHLDQVPSNSSADNLAFLCLNHHDQYDSKTRQSKGLTNQEAMSYRDDLYNAVETFRKTANTVHEEWLAYLKQQSDKIDLLCDRVAELEQTINRRFSDSLPDHQD